MADKGPISVEIEFDPEQLGGLKNVKLNQRIVRMALRDVGAHYLAQQRGRIALGQSPSGESFRPYSEAYEEKKVRAGRKPDPDLRLTGKMLQSQKVQVILEAEGSMLMVVEFDGSRPTTRFKSRSKKPGGRLTVSMGERKIENAVLAEANDRIRPFIGVSVQEAEALVAVFIESLLARSMQDQLLRMNKGSDVGWVR